MAGKTSDKRLFDSKTGDLVVAEGGTIPGDYKGPGKLVSEDTLGLDRGLTPEQESKRTAEIESVRAGRTAPRSTAARPKAKTAARRTKTAARRR